MDSVKKCIKCNTNCMENYDGKLILICGINNSLHAADRNYLKTDAKGNYISSQNVSELFRYLDQVLLEMLPKAQIKMVPALTCNDKTWEKTEMCQKVYNEINDHIAKRSHVAIDPDLPRKMKWIANKEFDKVHFENDFEGINYWKMVFEQE